MDEFDKAFTGIVLRFEKTDAFVPEGKPKSVWTFTRKRLAGTFTAFMFVILTSLLTAIIGMITPVFSRIFMDNILSGKNPEWLTPFIYAMVITLVLQLVVGIIQSVYWLKIKGKLAITANASFMWHVLRLPVEFFSQRFAGDIASRQGANESVAEVLIGQLAPVFVNVCMLIFYIAVMFNYSLILSIVGITAALLNVLVLRIISQKRVNMSRVIQRDAGKLSGFTMSGLEMIETIKASGAENGFFERWAGYFTKQGNALIEFNRFNQYYGIIPLLLQQVANIAVLMIGVYLILDGEFTIGMLMAFQGFLASFLAPVNQLVDAGQAFIEMRSSMERIEDVMSYQPDIEGNSQFTAHNRQFNKEDGELTKMDESARLKDQEQFQKLSGVIEINNLTFGYNKLSPPLIEDFSLQIKPGGSVAFIGGSGSGKSTLAKLISGLYQPWSGEICFDGKPRNEINRYIFTASLAVVDQDIILFEDAINNNLTMWDKSISEKAIIAACKDAQIHEDIMQREGGYSHIVKEGGKNFSGGQRQRFEIARALAGEPSIVILDEATSALDVKTEQLIMEAIKARGITLIIIAHRLSTIRDCDEIIILDKGRVVARGQHEELMKQSELYAELIATE